MTGMLACCMKCECESEVTGDGDKRRVAEVTGSTVRSQHQLSTTTSCPSVHCACLSAATVVYTYRAHNDYSLYVCERSVCTRHNVLGGGNARMIYI